MPIIDGKKALRRKGTKILSISPGLDDGEIIRVQITIDSGETVIAIYKRAVWVKAAGDIAREQDHILSLPPVATIRKRSAKDRVQR